ncbi:MAG: type II toxin-antitoxin system HicB family antitoxin [Desulfovibrio sp.]|nr:type II toxin-antitoxin system HicB family antitoxin [Desulfovibrio sp.]
MLALKVEFLPPSQEEERECWVALCPEIDLATQGETFEDAERNMRDALDGWFSVCLAMGTLDAALTECGFSPCRIEEFKRVAPRITEGKAENTLCHA